VPGSVPQARGLLAAFISQHTTDHEFQSRVALAFTEGFSNAVRHAYEGGPPGDVHVAADLEDDAVEVVIADDGRGFRDSTAVQGLGAGMGIMTHSADAFAIRERNHGGTEVWLRFDLRGAPVSAQGLLITLDDRPDAAILTIAGEVDIATSTQLKRALDDLIGRERPPAEIRVDLASVEFMDSSGIAILLTARRLAESAGSRLLIASTSPALRQLFESTGVAQALMQPPPPPG
jgi:anti-anti-sigma factor